MCIGAFGRTTWSGPLGFAAPVGPVAAPIPVHAAAAADAGAPAIAPSNDVCFVGDAR
jgi:hypothetical protein